MKRESEMTEEEKKSWMKIEPGEPISWIKALSRSQEKRDEYMREVERKRKEGTNV